jgi:predicted transcriptional regulator
MLTEREAIAAHIAEGFAQAERGELIDAEGAVRILRERRAKRDAKRRPDEPETPEQTER